MAEPHTADDHTLDGALARAEGKPTAALAELEQAIRLQGYFEGKRIYQMRSVLILAADAALAAGDAGKALEFARAARGIADVDSLTPTRSAYVGEARLFEARARLLAGDTTAARDAVRQALTALTFGAGPDHHQTREAAALQRQLSPP
jgi:hypothetical protein